MCEVTFSHQLAQFHNAGGSDDQLLFLRGKVEDLQVKQSGVCGSKGGQVVEGKGVVALDWNAANLKFPNHPEAEKYLSKMYREGWQVSAA